MSSPTAVLSLREPAHRVSPRAKTMWLSVELLLFVVELAVGITVGLLWLDRAWWWAVVAVGGTLSLAIALIAPFWRYAVHRWEVTETAVYTQTGWVIRECRIAPMSRIQTVDYRESALSRLFRLASVEITTASAAGAISVKALDRDTARGLADELIVRADASEGDAT